MTNSNKHDILIGDERETVSLLSTSWVQSKQEKHNCFSLIAEMHPFLLEDKMRRKEIWKTIPDFPDYQVSNKGRVKSLNHYVKHPKGGLKIVREKILQPINSSNGYLTVCLYSNPIIIHRLVAQTFIANLENKPCVNHIDGNKRNNNVKNLSWCTYSENEKWSYSHLGKKPNKTNLGNLGLKSRDSIPVAMFSLEGKLLSIFEGASDAARKLNKYQGRISTNCRGETHTCYKKIFRYISRKKFSELSNGKRYASYFLPKEEFKVEANGQKTFI
uniref:Putative HNH endonuclease n=1 Tax=viral metagenome TaxID=1070528 RepID=A0A6M3KQJ2_9ZZZZ